MSLRMLSLRPDFQRLSSLAARERLLPTSGDLGYALHAIFVASFGDLAPKPFLVMPPGTPGGGSAGRLLAYATSPLADLVSYAEAFADPAFSNVLELGAAEDKSMPERFGAGTRFGFRARVRPMVRTGKPRSADEAPSTAEGPRRARERDAHSAGGDPNERSLDARGRSYAAWLAEQIARHGGATLESTVLESFCTTKMMTRDRSGERQHTSYPNGPDATMSGLLRVDDGPRFAEFLARGVGRHRAFGFGMLLLRPPGG